MLADEVAKHLGPDWIIGFSDTWYGILAQYLANRHHCLSLIDAYDNYESYIPWCYPLHLLWREALVKSTAVSAAGPQLAQLLQRSHTKGKVAVVPMAADPIFSPMDQTAARKALQLPLNKKLIGYCGALHKSRGIEFLFQIAQSMGKERKDVEFVVSGRTQKGLNIPSFIRSLGYISDELMPALLNSMDVLLILNQDSAFGRYSYPAKLYEAMNCGIPVVASSTEPARWVLGDDRRFLARHGGLKDFICKIRQALTLGRNTYQTTGSWENSADLLEKILLGDVSADSSQSFSDRS